MKERTPEQIERQRERCREYQRNHSLELAEKKRIYNANHKSQIKERSHKYYIEHKDVLNEKNAEYHRTHKDEIAKVVKRYDATHRNEIAANQLKLKIDVLTHYGNGKCACVKCGCSDVRTLTIDHVNGGGNNHRRISGLSGGTEMYRWLKKQKYPTGYQTLCMNDQFIKKLDNKEGSNKKRGDFASPL